MAKQSALETEGKIYAKAVKVISSFMVQALGVAMPRDAAASLIARLANEGLLICTEEQLFPGE